MFSLLIYAGVFLALQNRVSSEKVVSLICNDTVWVQFGESATINCSIERDTNYMNWVFNGYAFTSDGVDMCSSPLTGNRCKSDDLTYVSLIISEVHKEQNVSVDVFMNHGKDDRNVRVQPYGEPMTVLPPRILLGEITAKEKSQNKMVQVIVVAVLTIITELILYLTFRKCKTDRQTSQGVAENGEAVLRKGETCACTNQYSQLPNQMDK